MIICTEQKVHFQINTIVNSRHIKLLQNIASLKIVERFINEIGREMGITAQNKSP